MKCYTKFYKDIVLYLLSYISHASFLLWNSIRIYHWGFIWCFLWFIRRAGNFSRRNWWPASFMCHRIWKSQNYLSIHAHKTWYRGKFSTYNIIRLMPAFHTWFDIFCWPLSILTLVKRRFMDSANNKYDLWSVV